jgi:hypothetical protein
VDHLLSTRKVKDKAYTLRELDGTVKREIYFTDQLKIFYYRDNYQTVRSVMRSVLEGLHPHLDWRYWSTCVAMMVDREVNPYLQSHVVVMVAPAPANHELLWSPLVEGQILRLRVCPQIQRMIYWPCTNPNGIFQPARYKGNSDGMVFIEPGYHNINNLDNWAAEFYPLR